QVEGLWDASTVAKLRQDLGIGRTEPAEWFRRGRRPGGDHLPLQSGRRAENRSRTLDIRESWQLQDELILIAPLHDNRALDDAEFVDPPLDRLSSLPNDLGTRDIRSITPRLVGVHLQR